MSGLENANKTAIVAVGGASTIIGVDQIQTWLGITLLGVQLVLVLAGLGIKLYKYIKAKKDDKVAEAIAEAQGEIDGLKQELEELRNRRNGVR